MAQFATLTTLLPNKLFPHHAMEETCFCQSEVLSNTLEELQQADEELRVQNEELFASNEQLLETQRHLEASRQTYVDLYDLAPVGYCTFDEHGIILEANLTLARLLGLERAHLIKMRFYHAMRDITTRKLRESAIEKERAQLRRENIQLRSAIEDRARFGEWVCRCGRSTEKSKNITCCECFLPR